MSVSDHNRWMPPSPHREKVLEILAKGRAHLEAQGHGRPPLLISEDGGAMELPQFRWVDGDGVAAESGPSSPSTKYLDVCGTIDELKRLLADRAQGLDVDSTVLDRLLGEALAMIDRMYARLAEYNRFRAEVAGRLQAMEELNPPKRNSTVEASLRTSLTAAPEALAHELALRYDQAEQVRDVAGRLETVLYTMRDLSIEIGALFEAVRGARQWRPPNSGKKIESDPG